MHVNVFISQGIAIIVTPLKSLAIILQTHRTLTSMIKFSKKTHWNCNYQFISKERINAFYKTNWHVKKCSIRFHLSVELIIFPGGLNKYYMSEGSCKMLF